MSFTLLHEYFVGSMAVQVLGAGDDVVKVSCAISGELAIRFPGKVVFDRWATYSQAIYVVDDPSTRNEGVDPDARPPQGHWDWQDQPLYLALEIWTPDGQAFTADHVTLDDLRRFRDLRGRSQGNWTFRVHGEKEVPAFEDTPPTEGNSRVRGGQAYVRIGISETVESKSAPPLVSDTLKPAETRVYKFDLFRLGTFIASARSGPAFRPLALRNPDGAVVASGPGALRFAVTPQTLDMSRDPDGHPRLWSLEAREAGGGFAWSHQNVEVFATVLASTRISTHTVLDRIQTLLGTAGEKLSIYGENRGTDLLVRLQIHDEVSAETFDMWGLLDARISSVPQDEGVTTDIAAGVAYNLYQRNMFFGPGNAFHVSNLGDLKVSEIKVSIGPSAGIQPSIPALMLDVGVQGQATIRVGGAPLATVGIRDNRVRLEVGVYLDEHGSLRARTWIDDAPIDLDVHWTTDVETALVSFGILTAVANEFVEGLEVVLNEAVQQHFRDVVEDAMNKAPQVLAVLMGDDFTYRDVQMHGDDLEFSYVAPLEPDPKPSAGYVGIIGRSAMQTGPTVWEMTPPTLGDTWSAQNLAKIDHIVVVMMENRSFDHVLGYRARRRDAAGSDGLTNALTDFLSGNGFAIRPLKDSDIPENSVHRKTGFPRGVGHSLDDVAKQLQFRLQAPSGRSVNSPQGFIDDFTGKANGLQPQDVLGYYEADDLPFFAFLAENYAYCEQYFCSHAGPTMPNRMFSLSGDVQYDRTGEAILDNNEGDYLYLSRGLTIFDLLTRKGVGWRVYESFPSITMLRWFARYAGDVTNIVSLGDDTGSVARLLRDVAGPPQDFPPVVFIDPAFHHHPQNDDHPEDAGQRPAVDMWRGQQLLKDVYDALVSNRELWSKTLLIITYDEHGGFYDHVIAPLAEALFQPSTPVARGDMGTIASSMTIRYGLRVPTFVVSPWTPAGKGPDMVLDHCSILKTITARFLAKRRHGTSTNPRGADLSGGHGTVYYTAPFLSDRVQASRSLDAYLSCTEPRLDVPASPTLESLARERPPYDRAIITEVLSRAQMRRGDVDFHALTGWLARQFGR